MMFNFGHLLNKRFDDFWGENDPDYIQGALKFMLKWYTLGKENYSGKISERSSLEILTKSLVMELVKQMKVPGVVFRTIHLTTFYQVSSQRLRMSFDLYISAFLPTLCTQLELAFKPSVFLLPEFVGRLVAPLFMKSKSGIWLPPADVIVDLKAPRKIDMNHKSQTTVPHADFVPERSQNDSF
ncbi:unnamed protein product [Calicophoron daubneyi]|uniref:Uncharacterized protein n=1 Tax=Calicophoron daubneyi TaxID=300641 RepID=A0AAV2TRH0_CALDB